MKHLSIEEKAKAYDEALKVLHKYDGAHIMFTQDLKEEMFPELREASEDEKIRKWIKNELESKYVVDNIVNNVMADKALAWLEKQGEQKLINEGFEASLKHVMEEAIECGDTHNLKADADMLLRLTQKPVEWSDEDESYLSNAIMYVSCTTHHGRIKKYKVIDWLKSIKDRVQPQLEKEWSDEDEVKDNQELPNKEETEVSNEYQQGYRDGFKCGKEYVEKYPQEFNLQPMQLIQECEHENLIKERLINAVNICYTEYGGKEAPFKEELIAYINKQGEQKPIKEHNVCDFCEEKASCINPCPMKLVEQKPTKAEPKFKAGDKVLANGKVYTIKLVNEDNYIVDENGRDVQEHFSYTKDWKLYERKPTGKVGPKFKVGQTIVYKGIENITPTKMTISDIVKGQYWDDNCCIVPISDQDNWELVEQKSNNKVESKFKIEEGKWYVCTQTFVLRGKIVTIKGQTYQAEKDNAIKGEDDCLFIDRHDGKASDYFKSWTIQDAKDGDVLSDETTIFIFKDLLSDGSVMSYCDYDTDSDYSDAFCHLSVNLMCSKITPATKEQYNALMKAMADAGYTFDFEKKELKKIEQKPADIPEDFERLVEHLLSLSDGEGHGSPAKVKEVSSELLRLANQQNSAWSVEDDIMKHHCHQMLALLRPNSSELIKDIIDNCHHWLKSIKSKVQPKIGWSERDELMLEASIGFIKSSPYPYSGDTFRGEISKIEAENWLETLKYRVQPQPKGDWSEEDENRFKNLIELIEQSNEGIGTKVGFVKFINRLKSLKPQSKQERCKEDNAN